MLKYKVRAQLYHTLHVMERNGISRERAMKQLAPVIGKAADQIYHTISTGHGTLSTALEDHPNIFNEFDIAMITVGEESGRLDDICQNLSDWYYFMHKMKSGIIGQLLYPLFMLHVLLIVVPILGFASKLYGINILFFLIIALGSLPYVTWFVGSLLLSKIPIASLGRLILSVPLFGTLLKQIDHWRFFKAFGMSLNAGIGISRAVTLSATSCQFAIHKKKYNAIAQRISNEGIPFVQALEMANIDRSHDFAMKISMLETGELSGTLAEMSTRVADEYGHQVEETIKRISALLPLFVYLCIAMAIVVVIIKVFMGYLDTMNKFL